MSYIDQIFSRANIQQIRSFLMYGTEELSVDRRTCKERLDAARKMMTEKLHELCDGEDDFEKMDNMLSEFSGTVEDVYLEIGLQCGIIIAAQIFGNLNPLK